MAGTQESEWKSKGSLRPRLGTGMLHKLAKGSHMTESQSLGGKYVLPHLGKKTAKSHDKGQSIQKGVTIGANDAIYDS